MWWRRAVGFDSGACGGGCRSDSFNACLLLLIISVVFVCLFTALQGHSIAIAY